MNILPIILVRPVCLHLHLSNVFAAFCRLGIQFLFDFISLYPYFHAKITTAMKFWLYLVSTASFNLHAIHLLIQILLFGDKDFFIDVNENVLKLTLNFIQKTGQFN